ncbi:MAG TPA: transposase, partial [Parasegetibacter sp.]
GVRRRHLLPLLQQLQEWLTLYQSAYPPDSPIGKAFTYASNHWHMLFELCEDGRLLPDNNPIERAIRPVTLYRKNSLFAGNEHGAERAALFFTLVENCKLHNVDPFEYLCDVYDRIYDCPASELEQLLPHRWVKK